MRGSVLVMAKAPVAGRAKTRLAGVAGPEGAAELAAAALLDTLEAGAAAFPAGRRVLALDGDLGAARRSAELLEAVQDWVVVPQGGQTFGERLVDGHRQAHRIAGGPVVQVGMDTPQVRPETLLELVEAAHRRGGPVLGPALDGGWWVLVTTHARQASLLGGVPMSRPDTGRLTVAALASAGHRPALAEEARDVDLPEDADAVAALAPGTRFARAWRALAGVDDRADVGSDLGAGPGTGPS